MSVRAKEEKLRRRLETLKKRDNEDGREGGSDSTGLQHPLPSTLPPQTLNSPPAFSPSMSPPTLDKLLDSEDRFSETESLNNIRNDLWNLKNSKPITSLTDMAERFG